jgi:glycerophosphoryl diester phosphodiesterase
MILRPPLNLRSSLQVVAHRGASAYAPENTLAAFELAVKMNAKAIELDTQLTTDGVVVLCHDETLERYGHGPLQVEGENLETLKRLDMGSWFSPHLYPAERLLTLRELFERFGPSLSYDVELKGSSPGLAAGVAALIKAYRLIERCKVTSFSWDLVAAMAEELPPVRRCWLVREVTDELFERSPGLAGVGVKVQQLSRELVARLHEGVPDVHAWNFVGSPQEVLAWLAAADAYGCDSLTLNWPDWVVNH